MSVLGSRVATASGVIGTVRTVSDSGTHSAGKVTGRAPDHPLCPVVAWYGPAVVAMPPSPLTDHRKSNSRLMSVRFWPGLSCCSMYHGRSRVGLGRRSTG